MTPYEENLLEGLDIPNWTPRASRSQKSQRHTEAVVPFIVQEQEQPKENKPEPIMLSRLKLLIGCIMAIFSLCMLLIIFLMWPTIVSSTSAVMTCNPPYVTTDCPHIIPSKYATPGN